MDTMKKIEWTARRAVYYLCTVLYYLALELSVMYTFSKITGLWLEESNILNPKFYSVGQSHPKFLKILQIVRAFSKHHSQLLITNCIWGRAISF